MKFAVRKIHKYLSFFISVQLLLWTVSGIYFAFNKIEQIRGEQYRDQENIFVDLAEFNFPRLLRQLQSFSIEMGKP